MLKGKRGLVLVVILLMGMMLVGCTGDDATKELTEGVEGPSEVIVGEESDEFVATAETGASYTWQVNGEGLGTFTAPQSAKTKFIASETALEEGTIEIRVVINNEPKEWMQIEVLNAKSETEYAAGAFHGIVSTADMKRNGYIAAGTIGILGDNNKPYMVKSDNRGITIDEKEFDRGGRFYDVQDVTSVGLGDVYYLIGYGQISGDINEAFALKLNKKMEVEKKYNSTESSNNDAYLRSGIISKNVFANNHLIAVGNRMLDNGDYAPYIVDINVAKEEEIAHHVLDSGYSQEYDFANPYYNLESIVEFNGGYLAVGFTNPTDPSRIGAKGIIMPMDEGFNVETVNTEITEKLYKIKKVNNDKCVVVGENGYIAEIDESGNLIGSGNKPLNDENIVFRDVIVEENNYVVVGQDTQGNDDKTDDEGVLVKITKDNLAKNNTFGVNNYANYLYGVAKATDGDYVAVGSSMKADGSTNSYIVKVNPTEGTVVNRVKE